MMERCKSYVGITCVDGSCPKANADEYAERCYDVVHSCDECGFYKGCEDCALKDTTLCEQQYPKPRSNKKKHVKDSTELSGGHLW